MTIAKRWKWKTTLLKLLLGILLLHLCTRFYTTTRYHHLLRVSGEVSLWLLLLTLACTPAARLFRIRQYRETRKYLGIYAFLFSLLHLFAFLVVENLNLPIIVKALLADAHMLFAVFGFLGLVPLVVTSNKLSIRKLRKNWRILHLTVYPAVILCVVHAWLITPQNMIYGVILLFLLLLRVFPFKQSGRGRGRISVTPSAMGKMSRLFPTQLMIWGPLVIILMTIFTFRLTAGQKYKYDNNHAFYSTWFMPAEMKTIKNETVHLNCNNGCHWTILPGLLPLRSWEYQMDNLDDHYGVKLVIGNQSRQEIREYLVNNAAELSRSKYSVKILDSLSGNLPMSFEKIPYIAKKHDSIQNAVYQRPSIRNLLNCPACHLGVEEHGNFKEKYVEIPD